MQRKKPRNRGFRIKNFEKRVRGKDDEGGVGGRAQDKKLR
jgi:hypothetical protein